MKFAALLAFLLFAAQESPKPQLPSTHTSKHYELRTSATKEQADWFNEFQRISSSPADAARNLVANGDADVTSLLPQVRVPTLVMHARHDARVPFESGRRMAAGIPGARFVPLESQNHVILPSEPAFARFLEEVRSFLETDIKH